MGWLLTARLNGLNAQHPGPVPREIKAGEHHRLSALNVDRHHVDLVDRIFVDALLVEDRAEWPGTDRRLHDLPPDGASLTGNVVIDGSEA